MWLWIKTLAFLLALASSSAFAESIGDAIQRQDDITAARDKAERAMADDMALSVKASTAASDDVPTLYSVMAMGSQYVLKFVTRNGSYIATESNREIGGKWRLVKADGLSALIQKGKEAPVRVYLSVPDDVEQAQSMTSSPTLPTSIAIPPMPSMTAPASAAAAQ